MMNWRNGFRARIIFPFIPIFYLTIAVLHQRTLSEDDLSLVNEKQGALTKKLQCISMLSSKESLPYLKKYCCMVDSPNSVVVVPSGMLGKCEHYISCNYVGTLDTGITDKEEMKLYRDCNLFSDCQICLLYPSCILLKQCIGGQQCSQYDVKAKLDSAMHSMRLSYEESLRKNTAEADHRKGESK